MAVASVVVAAFVIIFVVVLLLLVSMCGFENFEVWLCDLCGSEKFCGSVLCGEIFQQFMRFMPRGCVVLLFSKTVRF